MRANPKSIGVCVFITLTFLYEGWGHSQWSSSKRKPKKNNEKALGPGRLPVVRWTTAQTVVHRASQQRPAERVLYVRVTLRWRALKSDEKSCVRETSQKVLLTAVSPLWSTRARAHVCLCEKVCFWFCLWCRAWFFPFVPRESDPAAVGGARWPAQLWPHSKASSLRERRKMMLRYKITHTLDVLAASHDIPWVPDVQWSSFVWVKSYASVEVWSAANASLMSCRQDCVVWMT